MKRSFRVVVLGLVVVLTAVLALKGASLLIPSGTWQATGAISPARANSAAVLLQDGRILVSGGDSASGPAASAEFFQTDGTVVPAPAMANARSNHYSVTLPDGRVLVGGGVTTGGSTTSTAEIFDPAANSWSATAQAMIEARAGATAALLQDGRVVVAGGHNGTAVSSTIEIFNPVTGTFSVAGAMSSPRSQHAMAVLVDGRVLIAGGFNGTAAVATTDIFDPAAGTVTAGPALNTARFGHSATTLMHGAVVVIGGNNGNADSAQMDVTPTELFDPSAATPAFTALSATPVTPREGHLAILLPNNNSILIAGGSSAGAAVATAELFTPQVSTQGVWSYGFAPTSSMSSARRGAAASANQLNAASITMKRNGVVTAVGGTDVSGNALSSTESYGYPTVQTDASDYTPGTTVNITGSGFQPNELVTIQLLEFPLIDTHGPYTVQADSNGSFNDSSFTTDIHDLNIQFYLTVTGTSSGFQAQNIFSDAQNDGSGSMTVSPTTAIAGSSNNAFLFTFATDNGKDLTAGSQVTVQVPAGWTAPQNTNSGNPGFVSVANMSCAGTPAIASVSGGLITININCAKNGQSFTLSYAGGGTKVTAPTATGNNTFTTQTKQNGGTLTNIATQPVVTVNPGPASKLVFTASPSNSTGGVAFAPNQPVVTVQDQFGNTATGSSAPITLAITSGTGTAGATLTCNANPLNASSGTATFAGCKIDKAGNGYTLTATSSGLTSAVSGSFNITAGAATQLAFAQQPTNAQAGASITPAVTVQVQDAGGNVVTGSSASVTIAIGTNPGGGTLSGTSPVNAVNGAATFSNLSINRPGTGYTLTSSSSGLAGATSSSFNIAAASPTKLVFTTAAQTLAAGSCSAAITVQSQDGSGNPSNPSSTETVALTSTSAGGTFYSNGTCASAITSTTISTSTNVATFFYKDTIPGSPTITATGSGAFSASTTQTETISAPDLTATKTNTVSGSTTLSSNWSWKIAVANTGSAAAGFTAGQTILSDSLPSSNIAYGAVSITNVTNVTNSANISCAIAASVLTCSANGATVTIGAMTGAFTVQFTATPSATGTYVNPTGGACAVDPNNVIIETNKANNSCSDTVTVTAPDLTATKTNSVGGTTSVGNTWTWTIQVSNIGNGAASYTANNQVILSDNMPNTNISYSAPVTGNFVGVTNPNQIGCTIAAGTLTCVQSGNGNLVSIAAGGSFTVQVTATATAAGPFANPVSGGVCVVDPNNNVGESSLANNSCADTVTVSAANTSTTITSTSAASGVVGQPVTVNFKVTNTSGTAVAPTGTVTVSDGTPADNCTGTLTAGAGGVSTGSCNLTPSTTGAKTLIASYPASAGFNASSSSGTPYTVNARSTLTGVALATNPDVIGQPTTVTVTVSDTAGAGASNPGGTISFTPTGHGSFSGTCPLAQGVNPVGTVSCQVSYTPSDNTTPQNIAATYTPNDNVHSTSSGSSNLNVTARSTSTAVTFGTNPVLVGNPTTVTVKVMDTAGSGASNPGGTISFTPTGHGSFTSPCMLAPNGNPTGTVTCQVSYTPSDTTTPQNIAATYTPTDNIHSTSSGNADLSVTGTPPTITSDAGTTFTAGVAGTFTVTTSGTPTPSLSATVPSGITFTDNGNGKATIAGTLTAAGPYQFTITAQNGVPPNATQSFTLTVVANAPAAISVFSGSGQSATVGTQFTNPLVALVQDAYANPVPSVTVTFTAPGNGASGTFAGGMNTAMTNGGGEATAAAFTANNLAGSYTVAASIQAVASTANFSLTNTAGNPTQLQILVPGETAAPGTATGKTGTPNIQYVNGAFNATVNAVDQYFNVVSTVTDTVAITSNDPKAILPAAAALVNGTGTFSVTLETVSNPATTTLTATDQTNASITADTSTPIEVIIVYTAVIAPSMTGTGVATDYTLTVNNSAAPNTNNLSSVTVGIPNADQGTVTNVSVVASQQGGPAVNWVYDSTQMPATLRFHANSANDAVTPGGTITITFTTTSSASISNTPVSETWPTVAYSDMAWQNSLPLAPPEPTVKIGQAPAITSATSTNTFTYGTANTTFTVTSTGVPTPSLSQTGAPGWVTFADQGDGTALISGTPTAAGTFNFTITAHNGFGPDATQNFSLVVKKADAVVSVTPYHVTYDADPHTATGTAKGIGGVDLSAYLDLSNTTHTNAGTFSTDSWTFTDPTGNYNNQGPTTVTDQIDQATATISVTPYHVTYNGNPHTATGTATGAKNINLVADLNLSSTTHTSAGSYSDPWTFHDPNGNYKDASGNAADQIDQAPLTITANSTNKNYGATLSFTGTEFMVSSGTLYNNDKVNSVTLTSAGAAGTATFTAPGPTYPIIPSAAMGSGLGNYIISYSNGTLTIIAAPLTISANSANKNYGATLNFAGTEFMVSSGTLYNGDKVNSVTLTSAGAAGTATVIAPGPTYPIIPSAAMGSGLGNYIVSYTNGTLTVLAAQVSASIIAADKYFDGTTTASITSCTIPGKFNSDDAACSVPAANASFASANASATKQLVTATNITLTGLTAGNYALISTTATTYAFIKPDQTSTAVVSSLNPAQYGQAVTFTATVSNTSGTGATPNGSVQFVVDGANYGSPVPLVNGSATSAATSTLGVTGSPHTVTANYVNADGNFANSSGSLSSGQTITPAPLAVSANAQTKFYGDSDPPLTYKATGFQGTDSASSVLTGALARVSGENVGSYAISQGNLTANANYTINFTGNNLTISPATLYVTASPATKIFGQPDPPLGYTATGFKFSDSAASVLSGMLARLPGETVAGSPYAISQGSLAANANYTISFTGSILTITSASTTTTVTTSLSPSNWFDVVTFTATVANAVPNSNGAPTGNVSFYNVASAATPCPAPGSPALATASLSMSAPYTASYSTNLLQPGNYTILACYNTDNTDTNFQASSGSTAQTVLSAPIATLTPSTVSFGNQPGGTSSSAQSVWLCNGQDPTNPACATATPSTDALVISSIGFTMSNTNPVYFTQTNTCPATLNKNASCRIDVKFAPALNSSGIASAFLTVKDNSSNVPGSTQNAGLTGAGTSSINGVGSLSTFGLFATANGCSSLTMSGNGTEDGYNGPANSGNVGTNGNVSLSGNPVINGAVYSPNSGTGNCGKGVVTGLATSGKAQATGGLKPLLAPITYPAPPVVSPAPPTTSQNVNGSCPSGMTGCTNNGSKNVSLVPGTYGNVSINGGTTVNLGAGTYNFNTLTLTGNSVLAVNAGPVVINIAGGSLNTSAAALDLSGGSIVNSTGITSNVLVNYPGSNPIKLSGGTQTYAVIYAPSAAVNVTGGSHFYGSIVGSTINSSGNTAIHDDQGLSAIAGGNKIWFSSGGFNVQGLPNSPNSPSVKLYITNASISFTSGGQSYTVPVPNAVITFSSTATSASTTWDATANRWSTLVPISSVNGNATIHTFFDGAAYQVPAGGFPGGIQNVSWQAAFSTSTPTIKFNWQFEAAVYTSSFAPSAPGSYAGVTINALDNADPAGTPTNFKLNLVGGNNMGAGYVGLPQGSAAVVPTIAPMSVSPSSYDFGSVPNGTTATPSGTSFVLTNSDSVTYSITGITVTGTYAADFKLLPNGAPGAPNNCVGMSSLAPGASCNLYPTFAPTAASGIKETAKIVVSDGAANSPQTVFLKGTSQ
jgi:hypothetical protein